jgi:hypothetical protein
MPAASKLVIADGIDVRLSAYATLAGVVLASAPAATADIVWSGPVNINMPSTVAGVYINLLTGAFGTNPASVPGWDLNPWGNTSFTVFANNSASPNSGMVTDWPGGSAMTLIDNIGPPFFGTFPFPIDSSRTYGRSSSIETTGPTAFLLNSDQNYIAFRFLNETTGQYNYGWAHFSLGSSLGGQPRTLLEYFYQNDGSGIVPEPSAMALLLVFAAGAVGVRVWRKKIHPPAIRTFGKV